MNEQKPLAVEVIDKFAWITDFHTSSESRVLLVTLIDFLALSEKDPEKWPALETILYRAMHEAEARVWEEAANLAHEIAALEIEPFNEHDKGYEVGCLTVERRCRHAQAEAIRAVTVPTVADVVEVVEAVRKGGA
jgi:hypothetical protein